MNATERRARELNLSELTGLPLNPFGQRTKEEMKFIDKYMDLVERKKTPDILEQLGEALV